MNFDAKEPGAQVLALTDCPHQGGVIAPGQMRNLRTVAAVACEGGGDGCIWQIWGNPGEDPGEFGYKVAHGLAGLSKEWDKPEHADTLCNAVAAMEKLKFGGVGLRSDLMPAGTVVLDFDGVVQDGEPTTIGLQIFQRFQEGYIELSPGGRGLHVVCKASTEWDSVAPVLIPTASGERVNFELYRGGRKGAKFVRMTGAVLKGCGGQVVNAQLGVDWVVAEMRKAKPGVGPNGKRSGGGAVGDMDAAFAELAQLRPEKDPAEVLAEMQGYAAGQPRSQMAEVLRGSLNKWDGDHSSADFFFVCDALRRGCMSAADVVTVWKRTRLWREKSEREDYRASTLTSALGAILSDLRKKAQGLPGGSGGIVLAKISEDIAEALEKSGDQLAYGKGGVLASEVGNIVLLFRHDPRLRGLLGYNEWTHRVMRLASWRLFDSGAADQAGVIGQDDITRLSMWLCRAYGIRLESREILEGLETAARDAAFNPVANQLEALGAQWDGVQRVDSWLTAFAKIDDTGCVEYVRIVGRAFLVGAVARALSPGCQMDTVLSVEGSGGGGKSTMFRILAEAVGAGLFADGIHDVSSKASLVEGTGGRWIVELAELAGVRRAADVEALKAALTRTTDSFRKPYGLAEVDYPRGFVFVATTNRNQYLADSSGALLRRFWPVRTRATETNPIDRDGLAAVAPQLWGEAVRLYAAGAKWHLDESDGIAFKQWTQGREERREDGAFHDEVVEYLKTWPPGPMSSRGVGIKDLAKAVGDMRTVEGDQGALQRLSETLRGIGMESRKVGGAKRWFYAPQATTRINALLAEDLRREATEQAAG